MKVYKISKSQIGKKIGQIRGKYRDIRYLNVFQVYIGGEVQIWVESNMTEEEFNRFADAKLTDDDIKSLKARNIF